MDEFKISRIAAIKDEVKELHGLLRVLLPKLPEILNVEYTHGANEQGADFVLQKADKTLGQTIYIGIIAKAKNISPADLADIYSQIEQCEVERTFAVGKHKIRINEVWFLTSGVISHNSRENIQHKYSSRNVRFVARDELINLIDKHFSIYWTHIDVSVGDYFDQLIAELCSLDKASSILPDIDQNFYVAQNIYRLSDITAYNRALTRRKPEKVDPLQEVSRKQFLLLEGEPGVGKSKLLRQLARRMAEPAYFHKRKQIPIIATAREFANVFKGDCETLARNKLGINVALFEDQGNQIVVLIDGFDESKSDSSEIVAALEATTKSLKDNERIRVIATSRPLMMATPQGQKKAKANGWEQLDLQPLTNAQLFQFIKHLCKDLAESNRLFEDIKDSPILQELPKSPIAAILLADVLRQRVDELPSTLPELYAKYFEITLGRWEMKKGLESQKEYEALESILMNIASFMMIHGLDQISAGDAKRMFDEYLAERNLGLKADELLNKLKGRFEIATMSEVDGTFRFKHKTFAEFLHAKSLQYREGVQVTDKVFEHGCPVMSS